MIPLDDLRHQPQGIDLHLERVELKEDELREQLGVGDQLLFPWAAEDCDQLPPGGLGRVRFLEFPRELTQLVPIGHYYYCSRLTIIDYC